MENETKKIKIHHCFNCGQETEDWEELPNGRSKLYVCGESQCQRELSQVYREIESEARQSAEDDSYSRYY